MTLHVRAVIHRLGIANLASTVPMRLRFADTLLGIHGHGYQNTSFCLPQGREDVVIGFSPAAWKDPPVASGSMRFIASAEVLGIRDLRCSYTTSPNSGKGCNRRHSNCLGMGDIK